MQERNYERPWLLDSSKVRVLDGYAAEIIGRVSDGYLISFHDRDMSLVEARVPEDAFVHHPSAVRTGYLFGVIVYMVDGEIRSGAWPLARHWHESLRN